MDFLTLIQVLDSTVRLATPLLLACLAGLFSERAGIFDIGLEGKMLTAAFFSAAVAFVTGSVWLGLLASLIVFVLVRSARLSPRAVIVAGLTFMVVVSFCIPISHLYQA